VRYPRGAGAGKLPGKELTGLPFGKGSVERRGEKLAILSFGTMLYPALQAAEKLGATVVNMRWAKPVDMDLLQEIASSHTQLVTLEEGCLQGGAGSAVLEALQQLKLNNPVLCLGLPDVFIEHGDPAKLLAMQGLDAPGIEASIRARFG
jgi:1-deoxy-D-xylulose-5-phosphate synthase